MGYSGSGSAFGDSSLDDPTITLSGADYTVIGLTNVNVLAASGDVLVVLGLNKLPPASAVAGLSLFINGIKLPFSDATSDTSGTVKFFQWVDDELGRSNTIFVDDATLDLGIGSEGNQVVNIAAKTVSVDLNGNAEFTLTRTGNLANGQLVKLRYTQENLTSCAWFNPGEHTIAAKHWVMKRASVTFQLEPFSAGEPCGSFFRYKHPYQLGTTTSATVTVNN